MSVLPLEFYIHLSACLISLSAQTPALYWHLVQLQQVENSLFGEEQTLIWQEGCRFLLPSPASLDTASKPSPPATPGLLFFMTQSQKVGGISSFLAVTHNWGLAAALWTEQW